MTSGNSGSLTVEDWLALERFDYARVGERWAVLRLLAGIGQEHGAPAQAKLVVERDAGSYAEAADRGRELIDARPEQGYLYYNVACCESLAGRTADAIEHLRQAIDMLEGCRDMANEDSDFDPIRGEPAFQELIAR